MPRHRPIRVAKLREERPSGSTEPVVHCQIYHKCENEQAWEHRGDNFQPYQRSSRARVRSSVSPFVSSRSARGSPSARLALLRSISGDRQERGAGSPETNIWLLDHLG